MFSRIASVVDPGRIENIISNHSEMDHSGCLPEAIRRIKPKRVFASEMGVKALAAHFRMSEPVAAVKDGSSLNLGNMNLTFMETRMLHWPDSMISYLDADELLFSQDGFGMHLASAERFADKIPEDLLVWEGAKYFANILLPYSALILKLLDKVGKLGIPIKIIAPDHGPIWRQDLGKILGLYGQWAAQKPTAKAVVVYDTMWQSTAVMARAICDGLIAGGAVPVLLPMGASHRSDAATQILDAGALVVGSPTLNNGLFPTMADVMTYLKGLKPKSKVGAAFGSFGWSGEAPGILRDLLAEMKIESVADPLSVKYVPDEAALLKCREMGLAVAEKMEK